MLNFHNFQNKIIFLPYRNCLSALEDMPVAIKNTENIADFESGVYMGVGTFNLVSILFGLQEVILPSEKNGNVKSKTKRTMSKIILNILSLRSYF